MRDKIAANSTNLPTPYLKPSNVIPPLVIPQGTMPGGDLKGSLGDSHQDLMEVTESSQKRNRISSEEDGGREQEGTFTKTKARKKDPDSTLSKAETPHVTPTDNKLKHDSPNVSKQSPAPIANSNPAHTYKITKFEKNSHKTYVVIIRTASNTTSLPHPMTVGKFLTSTYQNKAIITKSDKTSIRIETCQLEVANKLLQLKQIGSVALNAYAPLGLYSSKGIVKGVDPTISDEDILKHAKTPFKILHVRRFSRRVLTTDGQIEYKPTGTILLTFQGVRLPDNLQLHSVNLEVTPYLPKVLQCTTCFRYGHTQVRCDRTQLCVNCGRREHCTDDVCEVATHCVNCSGSHASISYDCPVYKQRADISNIMTTEHLSYQEARNKITNFTVAPAINRSNFPSLATPRRLQSHTPPSTSNPTTSNDTGITLSPSTSWADVVTSEHHIQHQNIPIEREVTITTEDEPDSHPTHDIVNDNQNKSPTQHNNINKVDPQTNIKIQTTVQIITNLLCEIFTQLTGTKMESTYNLIYPKAQLIVSMISGLSLHHNGV